MRVRHGALCAAAIISLTGSLPPTASVAAARATGFSNQPGMAVGVAWYPEQWPEARWEIDLAKMHDSGFNVVRIAEFAWSRMEPEEGRYDFSWLDRAIAAAARHGMMVVLGTPTAAPPAWLTARYPDVLRVDENGQRAQHGARRHFSFASPRYRLFARKIATEMARRYGKDPRVVGWQIDNEIGPASFDPEAQALWHRFLQQRYGAIETLNRRWATQYWSQSYNSFDQVPLRQTGQHNPGLLLDFRHFTTSVWTDYIMNQAEAIRTLADKRQFITTNTMFWNAGFDHFALHRGLDMAAWDDYIRSDHVDWADNGANHDLVRGYKQRNFWVMETEPGRLDWLPVNSALRPGQVREMAWQAIGHGADALLYWQWRPAMNGQETYHGALLGQDGEPNPVLQEVAQTAREIARAAPQLADTDPVAKVAMLYSFDSRWALDLQRHHRDFDPIREFVDVYRPLRAEAQGVAVVAPDADLARFPLVVAPSLNVIDAVTAKRLASYVRDGGHLVLGPRSGQKDDANALWPERQPGPLAELLGAHVEQYYALDKDVTLSGDLGEAGASIWAETLVPDASDVRVLARFHDAGGWLDGKPAIVSRSVGRGSITYVGSWLKPDAMAALTGMLLREAKIGPVILGLAADIEVAERSGSGRRVLILINHGATAHDIALPAGARPIAGDLAGATLPAHGVAVVGL
ncbi:beta-galactosidase [Novosphingobium rosa]|uniref:beta-galactosidase n=1 Tax=Novosphingobium rosa TaxID=76978 RepID=UPI000829F7CD|nr:beta-galactosidase [Novosphingobium rosa]